MVHNFQPLKMYADKKMKFKQTNLIGNLDGHELKAGSYINNNALVSSQDGACAALSAQFLKYYGVFNGACDQAIIRGVIGQHRFKSEFGSSYKDYLKSIGLIEALDLPNCPGNLADNMTVWLRNDNKRNPSSVYITFRAMGNGRAQNHSVAAIKRRGKRMDFFDANVGWYEVQVDCESRFMSVLENCYGRLGFNISHIKYFPVKEAGLLRK